MSGPPQLSSQCSFCEQPATTKEHVVPQWLQRQYALKDQAIGLWNGTYIKYSQAVIPACKECNGVRFSSLEKRIQSGQASKRDYYLWALKIRFGLAIRDTSLARDRSRPEMGPILSKQEAAFGAEFVWHAFKALDDPKFVFHPDPFGSVFFFDLPADASETFDLVDVPPPYWALSTVIPPGKILLVLFADRGAVRKCLNRHCRAPGGFETIANMVPGVNARALMFLLLRWQNHLVLPSGIQLNDTSLLGEVPSKRVKIRTQKIDWYYEIAKHCNLSAAVAEEAFWRDKSTFSGRSIRLG